MAGLDQFIKNLNRSSLTDSSTVSRSRQQLPDGPDSDAAVRFARLLIQQGILTSYQAKKILAGATRGFFLGEYRILRPLGQGGMGKVYLAAHQGDGTRVAIKVLPPSKAQDGGQELRRFRREMDLSRKASHPNLARTLDVGQSGDVHFMILEYVEGESLYQLVKHPRGGPLRVPDAARYFLKVVDGLEAAHHVGLVHRDIKPSNLMVTPDGDAKILDLGLARLVDEANPMTSHNTVIGTLDYASPEQLGDAARADRRSDLYSLGCTFYFALSGHPPFEGGDVINKIFKQRMDEPEPLEQVARGVPTAFAAMVRKLMAKDPAERHQDCAELRVDLKRWSDPKVVRSILGAEAEAARAFRPPPPSLDDDEIKLFDQDSPSSQSTLRDLGEAEPTEAPIRQYRPRAKARPAVVHPSPPLPPINASSADEMQWLIRFVVGALGLGIIIILIAVAIRFLR